MRKVGRIGASASTNRSFCQPSCLPEHSAFPCASSRVLGIRARVGLVPSPPFPQASGNSLPIASQQNQQPLTPKQVKAESVCRCGGLVSRTIRCRPLVLGVGAGNEGILSRMVCPILRGESLH